MPKPVDRRVGKKGIKRGSAKPVGAGDIEKANARFDRLLEAMAKTAALPKKKKRVVLRDVAPEKFDD